MHIQKSPQILFLLYYLRILRTSFMQVQTTELMAIIWSVLILNLQ